MRPKEHKEPNSKNVQRIVDYIEISPRLDDRLQYPKAVHRGDDAYYRAQAAGSEEERRYFASTICLMAVRLSVGRYAHGSLSVSQKYV